MPIVHPTVENPDELLAWPGPEGPVNRIQIERSDTGGGAGYANIGSKDILAATRFYTFYDPNGDLGDWYRWYFSNAANTFPSSANRAYSEELQPGPEAASNLLGSLEDVKQRLGIAAWDTSDDETLLDVMLGVSSFVQGYTGRRLTPDKTTVYTWDGFDAIARGKCLLVPNGIRTLTQLEIAATTGGTFQVMNAADYFLRPLAQNRSPGWPAGQIWISDIVSSPFTYFPGGYSNVRGTGTFAFATTPADIQELFQTMTVRMWHGRNAGQTDQIGVDELGQPIVSRFLSQRDRQTLDRYRIGPLVA